MRSGPFTRRPDDNFEEVEQQLRQALAAKADSVEPSDDAFLRLTEAVAASAPSGWRRLLRPGFVGTGGLTAGSTWSPLGYIAAVVAVAVGLTTTLLPSHQDSNIAVLGPSTPALSEVVPGGDDAVTPPNAEDQGDLAADSGEQGDLSALSADEDAAPALADANDKSELTDQDEPDIGSTVSTAPRSNGYAPVRAASVEAVESFIEQLTLVELSGFEQRVEDDRVVYVGTDGSIDLARVDVTREQDSFAVAEISSDVIDLDLSASGSETATQLGVARFGDELLVAVNAEELVHSVVVEVVDALNGRVLVALERTMDGSEAGGLSFSAPILLSGSFRAWTVASGYSAAGELVGLHAEPIRFDGAPDPANYTVVGLRPFDSDGGLVVRDAPGGARIGLLDFATSGIQRAAEAAEVANDDVWWSIVAPDGTRGWVAAEFLMAVPDLSEASLQRWVQTVLAREPVGTAPLVGSGQPPLFDDRLTMGNVLRPITAGRRLSLARLTTASGWESVRNMPDIGAISFAEFYMVSRWQTSQTQVGADLSDGAISRENLAQFGSLPSVVIPISGLSVADDLDQVLGKLGDDEVTESRSAADVRMLEHQQVRIHVADGALPGEPTNPVIVGITLESPEATSPNVGEQGGDDETPGEESGNEPDGSVLDTAGDEDTGKDETGNIAPGDTGTGGEADGAADSGNGGSSSTSGDDGP